VKAVKYLLAIYNDPKTYATFSEPERATLFGEGNAIMTELTERGGWWAARPTMALL
jgi:hypothetical protein